MPQKNKELDNIDNKIKTVELILDDLYKQRRAIINNKSLNKKITRRGKND